MEFDLMETDFRPAGRRLLLRTLLRSVALCALTLLLLQGVAARADALAQHRPLIVFMSDFGELDDAVAICKGVMKTIAPDVEIIDLTHQVTPYSISEGSRMLVRTSQYYPAGTVFVTVIDPGVGTSRKAIVVKTRRGQYFVLPDNGLITQVAERDGVETIREIRNPLWQLQGSSSSTFHGRDLFSPVAAHLARGDDWTQVGPVLTQYVRLEIPQASFDASGIRGLVVALDGPYGNLVTNIDRETFDRLGFRIGDTVRVAVGSTEVSAPFRRSFGEVPVGSSLLYIDSRGLVSLAINQGNFAEKYRVTPPAPLRIFSK
jgi:S-adenosyl-L-methionine hydrolase (adenosine-forming)